VLTLVYTLNFLDRGLIILLLQPIKDDLRLSDTQLGFLTGIAFGLFYATLGIPIARWSDRGNRATITSIAIGLWGVTVMSCVFVANFAQLVAARVAAAVGESGCMPPTYSLLGDYFPGPSERTRAMAIYWLANPAASLISMAVGGWLNGLFGWRITFFLMGTPALLVATLVKLTVVDPRQHASNTKLGGQLPGKAEVLAALWHQRSSRLLGLAVILLFTTGLGLAPWYAAFMMRSHGMATAELGLWLGVVFGIGGVVGTLSGGYASTRWFADNEPAQLRLCAVMVVSLVPCFALFLFSPQKEQALLALVPYTIVITFCLGPTFALMQRLVVPEMRATTLAAIMLLANLVGMGIGPQTVGLLSDWLRPTLGAESLRYAMLAMSFLAIWAAYHFWRVAGTVGDDLSIIARRAYPETFSSGLHPRVAIPGSLHD
jgi:predicted MFS family arabinose efflux permease